MFGLSWDPGCPNPSPAILCDFYPPRPPYSSSNACFCSAQCAVQQQPVGFQHSGVLITGSHVSCSHPYPSLPHLFHFFPIDMLSFPLRAYGPLFKRAPSPHQSLRLSGSICCCFTQLFPLFQPQWTLPAPQPFSQNAPLAKQRCLAHISSHVLLGSVLQIEQTYFTPDV